MIIPMRQYNAISTKPSFLKDIDGFSLYNPATANNRSWIVAVDNKGNTVGILSYLGPEWNDDKYIVLCIVESKLKNKGISKLMLSKLFSFGYEVRNGHYKPDGQAYLKHQIDNHNSSL
jgi:hypothetical protein